MSTYTLLLDFGQGYEDFSTTLMADGFNPKVAVGAGGKHQTQTCQFMVRGEEITAKLYSATENVKAQLKRDGVNLFTGLIRPYISYSAEGIDIGKVSVEIIDYSELLDAYVYYKNEYVNKGAMEASYENYYIFNPSDTSKSIVHALASMCGITNVYGGAVLKQISLFELPGDSYVKDVLEDLLYQHQLDYRFDANGGMEIISTDITKGTVATVTDFRNKFNHSKADSSNEGCLLSYRVREQNKDIGIKIGSTEQSFRTGDIFNIALTWSEVINDREVGLSPYTALVDAKVLPEGCTFEWWKLNSVKAVGSKGDAGDFSVQTTLHSWDDEKATVSASYKGTIWLARTNYVYVTLYGNFDFIYKATTRAGASGNNPMTYDAKYIYSLSEAQALAEALAKKQNVNRYTYSFESFQKLEPNDLVMLEENLLLGLSAKVRILSRTEDVLTGLYKYTAEGAADSTLNPPIPEIKPLEIEFVPQGPALSIQLSETSLDVSDGFETIGASLSGYLHDYYNLEEYTWKVNGVAQSESGAFLSIPVSSLIIGQNAIECSAVHKGVQYVATAPIKLTDASSEPIVVASLNVVPTPTYFSLSSRGVCKQEQTITFTAVKTSIPADSTVSWVLYKNQQKVKEGSGNQIDLTISLNEKVSSIVAEATSEGHTGRYTVYGIRSGQPTPERVRTEQYINAAIPIDVLPTITTLDDGVSELINGDYAYAEVVSEDGEKYATAVEYVDGKWKELDPTSENYALISNEILPDALRTAIPSQSVLNLYVGSITGQSASIQSIFTKDIKVDGSLYGGVFDKDGNSSGVGPGFHLGTGTGTLQANRAKLENAQITGELVGKNFNTIAQSADTMPLSLEVTNGAYYNSYTVDTDFYAFLEENIGTSGTVSVSGTYQGTAFDTITFMSAPVSGSQGRFNVVSNFVMKTLTVYTNASIKRSYVSSSKKTEITYNGKTFTSDDSKYKLCRMTDAYRATLQTIVDNEYTIAKGSVQCGSIVVEGTEEQPIQITATPSGSYYNYTFSAGGKSVQVKYDYNSVPLRINLNLFVTLQGIQATNYYRASSSSEVGRSSEPFAGIYTNALKIGGWQVTDSNGVLTFTYKG